MKKTSNNFLQISKRTLHTNRILLEIVIIQFSNSNIYLQFLIKLLLINILQLIYFNYFILNILRSVFSSEKEWFLQMIDLSITMLARLGQTDQ